MDNDSAVLAWVGIVVVITLYVVAYDLWAHYTSHLTMTAQFQKWLREAVMGPIIFAVWIAVPVGLTYHFLIKSRG